MVRFNLINVPLCKHSADYAPNNTGLAQPTNTDLFLIKWGVESFGFDHFVGRIFGFCIEKLGFLVFVTVKVVTVLGSVKLCILRHLNFRVV